MTKQRQECHSTRACARRSANWAHCGQHSCKMPAQSPRGKTPRTKACAEETCLGTRSPLALRSHMCTLTRVCIYACSYVHKPQLYQLNAANFRTTHKPCILVERQREEALSLSLSRGPWFVMPGPWLGGAQSPSSYTLLLPPVWAGLWLLPPKVSPECQVPTWSLLSDVHIWLTPRTLSPTPSLPAAHGHAHACICTLDAHTYMHMQCAHTRAHSLLREVKGTQELESHTHMEPVLQF